MNDEIAIKQKADEQTRDAYSPRHQYAVGARHEPAHEKREGEPGAAKTQRDKKGVVIQHYRSASRESPGHT
jgi:hypothetical protein